MTSVGDFYGFVCAHCRHENILPRGTPLAQSACTLCRASGFAGKIGEYDHKGKRANGVYELLTPRLEVLLANLLPAVLEQSEFPNPVTLSLGRRGIKIMGNIYDNSGVCRGNREVGALVSSDHVGVAGVHPYLITFEYERCDPKKTHPDLVKLLGNHIGPGPVLSIENSGKTVRRVL